MKTILHVSCAVVLMTAFIKLNAQTALPYFTGFDNATQKSGWVQFQKGGTTGGWLYTTSASKVYSAPEALWEIYSTAANVDDWFVSPDFNLQGGGKIDSVRYMTNGFSTPGTADTVAIYLLQGSQDPATATKTLLYDLRGADYMNDGIYRKKANIVLPSFTGKSYIAFRFKCTQFVWLEPYFDNLALSTSVVVPVASFSLASNNVCKGAAVSLKDNSTNNPTAWNWQINGGTPSSATSSSVSVSFASTGTYTISLTSSNAAGSSAVFSKTVQVNACAGINDNTGEAPEIKLYPNPLSKGDLLHLAPDPEAKNKDLHLKIFNLLGELVYDMEFLSTLPSYVPLDLPAGSYIYRVYGTAATLKTGKLVVE